MGISGVNPGLIYLFAPPFLRATGAGSIMGAPTRKQHEPLLCSLGGSEGFVSEGHTSCGTSVLRENIDLGHGLGTYHGCAFMMEVHVGQAIRTWMKQTQLEEIFFLFTSECTNSNCSWVGKGFLGPYRILGRYKKEPL